MSGSAGRARWWLLVLVGVVCTSCAWPQFRGDAAHTGYQPRETTISTANVSTLTTAWTATPGNYIESSPAVANGVAFVGSDDGKLYAFDAAGVTGCSGVPKSCAPLWTATTDSSIYSSPAVANGVVYVGSADDKLYAYRPCSNPESSVGLAPCDVQNAYRLPSSVGGAGTTVAIVDAYHDPNAEADLGVYRATFGLAPCTTANGCFRQVNQDGLASNFPKPDAKRSDIGWAVEISLDLDMVSATCPNCKILLVEAPNTTTDLTTAEDTAATLGANTISNSYGTNESSALTSFDSHYNHPGVPIVVASGDNGYAAGPQWPAVIPSVTSAGGTSLSHTGIGRGWSESVWNDGAAGAIAGSACSAYEAKPVWQHDPGCSKRTVADVAAVAKNLAVYDTFGLASPGWFPVGGTSAASPVIAGVYALGGSTAGTSDVYAQAGLLFDVATGNNGTCNSSYLCTAGPGYDGPTGFGTPCGVGAFGAAFSSPGGCGSPALTSSNVLGPLAQTPPLADYSPACRTAPPGGVQCFAYYRPRRT